MQLKDCYIGQIVREKEKGFKGTPEVGWIVGLALNIMDEVNLMVKWARYPMDQLPQPYHPSNLEPLE